jgi:hypothetical protein
MQSPLIATEFGEHLRAQGSNALFFAERHNMNFFRKMPSALCMSLWNHSFFASTILIDGLCYSDKHSYIHILRYRAEKAATGTSMNTPDINPITMPLLEFRGNVMHSNAKYGLRIYDNYEPTVSSVFKDFVVWRNAKVGFVHAIAK